MTLKNTYSFDDDMKQEEKGTKESKNCTTSLYIFFTFIIHLILFNCQGEEILAIKDLQM